MEYFRNLTIEFLEGSATGLRLVSQFNSSVECLLSSSSSLRESLRHDGSRHYLDVPGVYLLIGSSEDVDPSNPRKGLELYVGQGDSVADRLESHLRNDDKNTWFRTAVVLRRPEKDPLNLTHCRYLESAFIARAIKAGKCNVHNRVSPLEPNISPSERTCAEDFLEKALVILNALGWSLFQPESRPAETKPTNGQTEPPTVMPQLVPLLEDIRKASTSPSFPKAVWYPTAVDDRAKFVGDTQFRVFNRVKVAKNWFSLELKDVGRYKIKTSSDLNDEVLNAIEKAYKKAEDYLQRGSLRTYVATASKRAS